MSAPSDPSPTYRVSYSEMVRQALRELIERATQVGAAAEVIAAVQEIDYRLAWYPQFGDPLMDLTHESGHIRVGTVPPLVVRYSVLEARRLVFVTFPFDTLPRSGF